MIRRRWVLIVLSLLVLQPMLPGILAHGEDAGQGHHNQGPQGGQYATDTGVIIGPQAQMLTPDARYVEQRNPEAFGDTVVWQEKELGRDWDVIAYNLSTGGPAFPITLESVDQTNPVTRGPWIAWEEHHTTTDIAVLNLKTGEQFRVPDSGADDVGPTIGANTVYWQVREAQGAGLLRGYDLLERKMIYPAGNQTVLGAPDAWGDRVAWKEGSTVDAKLRVLDRSTGRTWSAPGFWSIEEGPELSPWGVAIIANNKAPQPGTYTVLFELDPEDPQADTDLPMRTGKLPHENLGACDTGILWDQFQELDDGSRPATVAIWDGFTRKIGDFGYGNHDATCTGDWLLYEKELPPEDEDLDETARIYVLDLSSARPPQPGELRLDPGLENGIFDGQVVFRGTFHPGDPREALEGLWATVDGRNPQPVQAREIEDGYEWRVTIDASRYFSGQHALQITAIDGRGTETRQGFTFFTNSEYRTDASIYDQPLFLPVERQRDFPYNVVDHYEAYGTFYNTVLLALGLLALLGYGVYRWVKHQPPAAPEFVRPDRDHRSP